MPITPVVDTEDASTPRAAMSRSATAAAPVPLAAQAGAATAVRPAAAADPAAPVRSRRAPVRPRAAPPRLTRQAAPVQPADPAPAAPARPAGPARIRKPEQHSFSGSVTLTAGPFDDLDQIGEFRRALSAIQGVSDVTVRTFQGRRVIFELDIAEPTVLIAALRARSARIPQLLHASEDIVRVSLA